MPKVRPIYNGRYKLDKHEFYAVYHYALRYHEWERRYNSLTVPTRAIAYDDDKVQKSTDGETFEKTAIERMELKTKMDSIEEVANETDPELSKWLIEAVTNEGVSYNTLRYPATEGKEPIPCGRNQYYDRRRKFYYLLSKKLAI